VKSRVQCVISGFCREVDEKSARLGYHYSLRNNADHRYSQVSCSFLDCAVKKEIKHTYKDKDTKVQCLRRKIMSEVKRHAAP